MTTTLTNGQMEEIYKLNDAAAIKAKMEEFRLLNEKAKAIEERFTNAGISRSEKGLLSVRVDTPETPKSEKRWPVSLSASEWLVILDKSELIREALTVLAIRPKPAPKA